MMKSLKHSLWPKKTGEEANQLLDHDLTQVRTTDKAVKASSLFRAYVLILHVVVLALLVRQWGFAPRTAISYLVKRPSWCK
jgi:hypothetical protein